MIATLTMALQTLHVAFMFQAAWHSTVESFANPMNLVNSQDTAISTPILNGIVTLVVQLFFAWYEISESCVQRYKRLEMLRAF